MFITKTNDDKFIINKIIEDENDVNVIVIGNTQIENNKEFIVSFFEKYGFKTHPENIDDVSVYTCKWNHIIIYTINGEEETIS